MGKRSLPSQRRFWGSVLLALTTWTGLVSLPVLAGWGLWGLLHSPENPPSPAVVVSPPVEASDPTVSDSAPALPSPASPPPDAPGPPPLPDAPLPGPPADRDARASLRLQVLNGSGRARSAAKAARVLREAGWQVVAILPARGRYAATEILYQPGNDALAMQVAKLLGVGRVRPASSRLDRSVAVTVVVGSDYPG